MTTLELVKEAHEKTHWAEMEILDLVRRAWPGREEFTPTQCALVVIHIERMTQPLTHEQIWGEEARR